MGIRAFIAALVGGAVGFAQFLLMIFLDASRVESALPKSDFGYWIFAGTWIAEMFALMTIAMYRFSPWVARCLRDDWEAERILRTKPRHVAIVERLASAAILLRAVVRATDAGLIAPSVLVGVAFGLIPFLLPRPPTRKTPPPPASPSADPTGERS